MDQAGSKRGSEYSKSLMRYFNNACPVINYYNKSKTGGHSYSILPEKLKSFYVSLYVNKEFDEKMEIDDYFQI